MTANEQKSGAGNAAAAGTTETGAESVAAVLKDAGATDVFGIVSIHNMPLFNAFAKDGGFRAMDMRHEQSAMHAADGYARATGRLGVAIASTGPGTTNTATGLYEAAYASSPALLITGQAETRFLGKGRGYVHEHERQLDTLRSVAPHVARARSADSIAPQLRDLIAAAQRGRPQPAALEIPIDLQYDAVSGTSPEGAGGGTGSQTTAAPDADALAKAVALIQASRKRVILAGGGVIRGAAWDALQQLAQALGAPVFTTVNGRGAIPENHELALGNHFLSGPVLEAVADADLTIAIGTRFQAGVDGRNLQSRPPGKLLHIDADAGVIDLCHRSDLALVADARATLEALCDALNADGGDAEFLARARAARGALETQMRKRIGRDHEGIMDAMRSGLPDEGILVRDSTIPAYFWGNQLFPIYQPRTSISSVSGAIGPALPLGLGAAAGSGARTVVMHGDGGVMLHIGELASAAQHQLPVTLCVFNDGGYGILRWLQSNRYQGEYTNTDLGTVDFCKVAEGMGVPAARVRSVAEFEKAFAESLASNGPYVIDIDETAMQPVAGMLMPGQSSA